MKGTPSGTTKTGGGRGTNQHAVRGRSVSRSSERPAPRAAASLRSQADLAVADEQPFDFENPRLNRIEEGIADRQHALALATAMAPDPTEWSYEGEVLDGKGTNATCACGHGIRWIFPVRRERDGATLSIGSTCIESTVPILVAAGAESLADDLEAAMESHRDALAEIQRRQRDASADVVVRTLASDFETLGNWKRQQVRAFRERRGERADLPPSLQQKAALPKAASTPGRTAASMRDRYAKVVVTWATQGDPGVDPPPAPEEESLRSKITTDLASERSRTQAALERTRSHLDHAAREVEANPAGFTADQDKVDFRAGILLDTREGDRISLAVQERLIARLDTAAARYR